MKLNTDAPTNITPEANHWWSGFDWLAWLAVLATAVAVLVAVIWVGIEWNTFRQKPNELGDFLGGLFGPIALLWLVGGYYQQQRELRLNTAALSAQVVELQKSVDSQESLSRSAQAQLDTAQAQLRLEREHRGPFFSFDTLHERGPGTKWAAELLLCNKGENAYDVRFTFGEGCRWSPTLMPIFVGDSRPQTLSWNMPDTSAEWETTLSIEYAAYDGVRERLEYHLERRLDSTGRAYLQFKPLPRA